MFLPILLRILLILVLGIASFYVATQTYFWLVSFWLLGAMLFAVYDLVRYLNRTRRQMAEFIMAVGQDDFTNKVRVPENADSLDHALTFLNNKLSNLRQHQASNAQFLQAVIEHIAVALVGYEKESEKITVMNGAAKELFGLRHINKIDGLSIIDSHLVNAIRNIHSGEKLLLKLVIQDSLVQLSLTARELVLEDEPYKLVSFQNIQSELEEKEVESWQKLIRVLTHEIKNSAIPISTLSEVIRSLIIDEENNVRNLTDLSSEDREDLRLGLETVGRRSQSLVSFVNAYSELARLPDPEIASFKLLPVVNGAIQLFQREIDKMNIQTIIKIPADFEICADKTQMEQVIINLVKNGIEAMVKSHDRELRIDGKEENGLTIVQVEDTGEGMDPATMEKVFIPFFTTKKQGSGIGLSLSRQILRAHGGELRVKSTKGTGTTFTLVF